jgi:hypothetical protein
VNHVEQLLGHQRRLAQPAQAHRDVDPILHQIEEPIGEEQLEVDLRVAVREAGEERHQALLGKRHRGGDAQQAARPLAAVGGRGDRRLEPVDQRLDLFEPREAGLGRGELAGRAVEQTHAEPSLQAGAGPRDR